MFTAVTGVSGSGKSTLVNDILYRALARSCTAPPTSRARTTRIDGIELHRQGDRDRPVADRAHAALEPGHLHGPVHVHPRAVRDAARGARRAGFKPGRFSFNVKGGRCEACQGDGVIAIEMHFLPNVYVTCEQCKGRRYNRETLEIQYRGKSIADVLDLTVDQALPLLENFPPIANKLRTLQDVGLGYIELGQSATTLSGGEAQRVKLVARALASAGPGARSTSSTSRRPGCTSRTRASCSTCSGKLVEQGNTVVVIEHNLDVIKSADHVIDLGPEGGEGGRPGGGARHAGRGGPEPRRRHGPVPGGGVCGGSRCGPNGWRQR